MQNLTRRTFFILKEFVIFFFERWGWKQKKILVRPNKLFFCVWRKKKMSSRRGVAASWLLAGPLPIAGVVDIVSGFMEFEGVCMQEVQCPEWINAVAFIDDDIFVGVGRRVRMWSKGQEQLLVSHHTDMVVYVEHLGGFKFATSSWDCSVIIWHADVKFGQLEGHADTVTCLARVGDTCVASGSSDLTVRVWDHTLLTCLLTLHGHSKTVWCLTTLADGCLVSGSADTTVRLWNEDQSILCGHVDWVMALARLDDGTLVSGALDRTIRLWKQGTCVEIIPTGVVRAVGILPSNVIVCACDSEDVILFKNGKVIYTFSQSLLNTLATWKNRIIVGTKNGQVRVFE
jgi:WD40 repeat protein